MWAGRDGGGCASFSYVVCLSGPGRQQHGGQPAHRRRKRAISPERVDVVRQVGLEMFWPMPALHSGVHYLIGRRVSWYWRWVLGFPMRRSPHLFQEQTTAIGRRYTDLQALRVQSTGIRRPGGMAKSQTPKTPTLTRTMRHINKWRMVTDGHHRGPTCPPACLLLLSVRVWNHASGESRACDVCKSTAYTSRSQTLHHDTPTRESPSLTFGVTRHARPLATTTGQTNDNGEIEAWTEALSRRGTAATLHGSSYCPQRTVAQDVSLVQGNVAPRVPLFPRRLIEKTPLTLEIIRSKTSDKA